jgi:hypothetical protein
MIVTSWPTTYFTPHASCDLCGWTCTREDEEQAVAAGQVHALWHRVQAAQQRVRHAPSHPPALPLRTRSTRA